MKKIDFKSIKKRYYVIAFIVLLLIIFIGAVTYYSFDPKDDFNAMICHSVLNNEDNGHIYCYHIYATDNNHYEYIKTKRTIKKGKNGSIGRVASGKINGEKDYDKLVKNIDKDNKKNYSSLISCTYVDNGMNMYYDSTDVLKEYLFKE